MKCSPCSISVVVADVGSLARYIDDIVYAWTERGFRCFSSIEVTLISHPPPMDCNRFFAVMPGLHPYP